MSTLPSVAACLRNLLRLALYRLKPQCWLVAAAVSGTLRLLVSLATCVEGLNSSMSAALAPAEVLGTLRLRAPSAKLTSESSVVSFALPAEVLGTLRRHSAQASVM